MNDFPPVTNQPVAPLPPPVEVINLTGTSHASGYPGNLQRLAQMEAQIGQGNEGVAGVLVRDPDNRYDRFAIAVHVPALGPDRIGWIPAKVQQDGTIPNRTLALQLDAGHQFRVSVFARIKEGAEHQPGASVRIERVT